MAGCPPPFAPQRFDIRNAASCIEMCRELLDAYGKVITGNRTIEVRFNERWTTYDKSDAKAVLDMYLTIYNQCPAARASGLPDMNPNKAVRRGAPARGFWSFPRM